MVALYIHWHWNTDDFPQWRISVDGIQQTVLHRDLVSGRVGQKPRYFSPQEWQEALERALEDYRPRVQEALIARDKHDDELRKAKMEDDSKSSRIASLAAEIGAIDKQTPPPRY